jgi:hypothetical protein
LNEKYFHVEIFRNIWRSKIPDKIKIFIWLVAQKAILAKDNMLKKWKGNPGCYFCGSNETVEHLLFSCPIAKVIWGFVAFCFQQNDRPKIIGQVAMNSSGPG